MVRPQNFALVVNPFGGRGAGLRVLEQVRPLFDAAGVDVRVFETDAAGHATDIVAGLSAQEFDAVCSVGGDGTLHEVVNGLMRRSTPGNLALGVVPAGSGNSFAQEISLDPAVAVARVLRGRRRRLDLMRVESPVGVLYACNIVGWAMPLNIGVRAEGWRWLRSQRYAMASLIEIALGKTYRARLQLDEDVEEGEYSFLLACNSRYAGTGMRVAPDATFDDGRMDVVIAGNLSRWQMFRMFLRVFKGTHLGMTGLRCRRVRRMVLTPVVQTKLNIDGEIAAATPVSVQIVPGAVELLG